VVVLARLVFLGALLLRARGRQKEPLLGVLARAAAQGLPPWVATPVMAALALAARLVVAMILPRSRSLLPPSCRALRSLRSFSSLLEAFCDDMISGVVDGLVLKE
jgi:hypothetical protein